MSNLAPALSLPLVIGRYPVRTWAGTSLILTEVCRYLCQSFKMMPTEYVSSQVTIAFFHFLCNSAFTNRPIVLRYITRVTESFVNKLQLQ